MNDKYEAVIGLEVHVELKTRSKAFCSCPTDFGAVPNTNVCPVCAGMPGALPVLNKEAVRLALKAAMVLGCEITREMWFDRKNYFYPDLPKGYQITQHDRPIGRNGKVSVDCPAGKKDIRIERIHIEEDAGKLIHKGENSYLDCNRCGIPLAEIVSMPDMNSAEEAKAYLEFLRRNLSYLGVSDCKMNEGSMRCDINVSLREKGCETLGTKVEIKNLNSINYAGRAIDYEIKRQSELLDNGQSVVAETRRFDENSGKTESMRKKETEVDYRYFAEPDIPSIVLSDDFIGKVRSEIGMLPREAEKELIEKYGLRPEDAELIASTPEMTSLFHSFAMATDRRDECTSLFVSEIVNDSTGINKNIESACFGKICNYMADGKIVSGVARKLVGKCAQSGKDPDVVIKEEDLMIINDEEEIKRLVAEAIAAFPKALADFRAGKTAAAKQIVGAVMRNSRGKANPLLAEKYANEMMK